VRKLTLPERFRLKDEIEVEDPLGMGWTWVLRYFANPDHLAWQEKNSDGKNIAAPMFEFQQRCAMKATGEAQAKGLRGKPARIYIERRTFEIQSEEAFNHPIEAIELTVMNPTGLAEHVVRAVRGVEETNGDGEVRTVDPSKELHEEILTMTAPLPFDYSEEAADEDDDEFFVPAGTQLGVFYRRWVTRVSRGLDRFRESAVETAGKDFAGS